MSQSWWNGPGSNQVIGKRYQLLRQLREEPWSDVWLAKDLVLQAEVSLKLIATETPRFERARDLLLQEAVTGLKLHHPHILGVYFLGETTEEAFLVQEPFRGETLLALLNRLERFRLQQALHCLEQTAQALAYAHKRRVVHHCLDPANILILDGDVRVANFASPGMEEDEEVGHLELRAFQAPEVIHGDDVTPAANVFSLGVLGFRLLVGSLPYPLTFDEPFPYRLESPPVDLEEVPIPLQNLLLRCLAVDPEDRFEDAGAFLAALEQNREEWRGSQGQQRGWQPRKVGAAGMAGRSGEIMERFKERSKDLTGKVGEGLRTAQNRLEQIHPRIWWGLGAAVLAIIILLVVVKWFSRPSIPPLAETPATSAKPLAPSEPPPSATSETTAAGGKLPAGPPAAVTPAPGGAQTPGAVTPAPAEDPYFVQAATYKRKEDAQKLAKRLKEKQYTVRLTKSIGEDKTTFVVWVGPVSGKKAAEETARRLKSEENLTVRIAKAKTKAPAAGATSPRSSQP